MYTNMETDGRNMLSEYIHFFKFPCICIRTCLIERRFKALFRNVDNVQLRGSDWDEATSDTDPTFFDYLNREAPERMSPVPLD